MSIKPALGWLGLLLFTTTAQAEGARDLLPGKSPGRSFTRVATTTVTPKTKAAPATTTAPRALLALVESTERPRKDYEAEIFSGVPLDGSIAKERGLDKGLVTMVFGQERRAAFRIARDRIHRVARFAGQSPVVSVVRADSAAYRPDHVDVLDTEDGIIVVDTVASNAGVFVTSDVYTFTKGASLEQRLGALGTLPSPARARVREALIAADRVSRTKPAR